jgi:hypothetical protein
MRYDHTQTRSARTFAMLHLVTVLPVPSILLLTQADTYPVGEPGVIPSLRKLAEAGLVVRAGPLGQNPANRHQHIPVVKLHMADSDFKLRP